MTNRLAAALAVSASLLAASTAAACPVCADATEEKSEADQAAGGEANLALGYAVSILFMMSMPFTIVGGFGYMLYRNHRETISGPPLPEDAP